MKGARRQAGAMEQAGCRRLNWPAFLLPSEGLVQHPPIEPTPGSSHAAASAAIYAVAFVTGAIVMSFEMLGSRYLNPYFGRASIPGRR
jgi:hypothetical protein